MDLKHKIGYISFVGYLTMAGIAIGVAALILTIAILDGFEGEISRKIIQFENHIQLRKFHNDPIKNYQNVSTRKYPFYLGPDLLKGMGIFFATLN